MRGIQFFSGHQPNPDYKSSSDKAEQIEKRISAQPEVERPGLNQAHPPHVQIDAPAVQTLASRYVPKLQALWQLLLPFFEDLKLRIRHFPKAPPAIKPIISESRQREIERGLTLFPELPDNPEERNLSRSPQKKADFPSLPSTHMPIRGNYPKEAEMVLDDDHTGLLAYQYGNLNQHGAFWLEDIHGNTLGLLSRQQSRHAFGDPAVPRYFYEINIERPHPDLPERLRNAIENRLVQESVKQSKADYIRLVVAPKNPQEAALFRRHGFDSLQKNLNRYEIENKKQDIDNQVGEYLSFDGFLDGYGANFFRRNAVN